MLTNGHPEKNMTIANESTWLIALRSCSQQGIDFNKTGILIARTSFIRECCQMPEMGKIPFNVKHDDTVERDPWKSCQNCCYRSAEYVWKKLNHLVDVQTRVSYEWVLLLLCREAGHIEKRTAGKTWEWSSVCTATLNVY